MRRWLPLVTFLAPAAGWAQAAPPGGHEGAAFDFMNLITEHGLHDIDHESWNAYGQSTYISSWKQPFRAPYTGPSSLLPTDERSFTWTVTLFWGARLWPGAEAYFVPEVISERPLSGLHGLGGSIQNFELQKSGGERPQLYRARLFLRQQIDLGGTPQTVESNPMQLGGTVSKRRVVLTAGNFTVLDVFDRSNVNFDPRQGLINMAFMTHSAWDFAADARGYSWGGAVELYWDEWALRLGRMAPPKDPNVLPIDYRIWRYYSDVIELEHDHVLFGLPGAVRLLAYRNYEVTGRFDDAIAAWQADPSKNAAACTSYNYGSPNAGAPDLCWVRRPNQKLGVGINVEQFIAKDVGVFLRAMVSDGQTEVDAFDPADRSASLGIVGKGSLWNRPFDATGTAVGLSWISDVHARYLALGGVDGFVGDGALRQAAEGVFELFYSLNLFTALWLTLDYQFLWNPGFNADRGPVHIVSGRLHAEF